MEKKIRFGDLVRNSGRPGTFTLWMDPRKDRKLNQAKRENRILTIVHEPKKRDFGLVGFHQRPIASYLVFPRALPAEQGTRVFGINYQMIEEQVASEKPHKQGAEHKRLAKPEPKKRRFKVRVRRTARLEDEEMVEAENRRAGEQEAMQVAKQKPFAIDNAVIQEEVVKK